LNRQKLISIIIPAHECLELTQNVIKSIFETTRNIDFEIILVNNGSGAQFTSFFDELSRKEKRLSLINVQENQNFAKACDIGYEHSTGKFLLFLNNDIIVKDNWLDELISLFKDEKIGIVGSRLLYSDNTIQHDGLALPLWLFPYNNHKNESFNNHDEKSNKEVFAVTGACLMIHNDLFLKIGGFDEKFYFRLEDVDLCMKVRDFGLKILCSSQSNIVHLESRTKDPNLNEGIMKKNFEHFIDKWNHMFNPIVEKKILEYKSSGMKNVIIYGTGFAGKLLAEQFIKHDINITGFMDKDENKWESYFMEKPVFSASSILNIDFDKIFVASSYQHFAKQYLENAGIKNNNIEEAILLS
jgi:GT2 family glycosyltransferase